ncbi:hypothetical protein Fmac_001409 [Flemingia macrophylla]|uniref:Uncharacterized protein n=1 Tax=Flemingia macrophylla TaxID=520843 RepID=A0ABD1NH18_9FABA
MIDMFNIVLPPTISKASGNEMYGGTSGLLTPKTLVSHCICTGCLLNRGSMLRSLDIASSSASGIASSAGIAGGLTTCLPRSM